MLGCLVLSAIAMAAFAAVALKAPLALVDQARASTSERLVVDRFTGLALGGVDPVAYFTDAKMLTGRPDVSLHLLRALAQRLRRANDVMADLVFTDVPGRVAKALLDLADRFGEQTAEGLQVHHDLTQEELAQLVGASRETVNKALADFAARGWLTLSAKSVLIIDPERLAKRAH